MFKLPLKSKFPYMQNANTVLLAPGGLKVASDIWVLTKQLIVFVSVILCFFFCLLSECFFTITENKVLVPTRTRAALTLSSQTSFHKHYRTPIALSAQLPWPWSYRQLIATSGSYTFCAGCLKLSVPLTLLFII